MDVLEAIKGRRSIRRFKTAPLPASLLSTLEDSLLEAPSAGNLQSRKFYFVFRGETGRQLARAAYHQDFIQEAPLAVVCCANLKIASHYGERGRSLYCNRKSSLSIARRFRPRIRAPRTLEACIDRLTSSTRCFKLFQESLRSRPGRTSVRL